MSKTHQPPAYLVTQQAAADTLGVSVQTIARMIRRGELDSVHVGRNVRVTVESINAYLRAKGVTK
jgi:excisionase family DNA binding protein